MSDGDNHMPRIGMGAADDQALHWYARMRSGEATPGEVEAFESWYGDPANAAAYAELEHVWALMQPRPGMRSRALEARRRRRAAWRTGRTLALAASLALTFGLGIGYMWVWRYDAAATGSVALDRFLVDGSHLKLAPGSAVDIDYDRGVRHVALARGDVYFDVKHDPARPFVIDAGGAQVRVLGTAFSVRRDGDAGEVVVERGKVRVSAGSGFVDLVPGQAVSFSALGNDRVTRADPVKRLAWTKGRLVFEHRPLGEVLGVVDAYYPGVILLMDREAARRPIDATIDLQRIDVWLDTLRRTQGLKIRHVVGVAILS